MDSSVSLKDQIWFLRVCHHVSNELYRVLSGVKAAGAWFSPPTRSRTEVKERVELYLYSPLWAFVACSKVGFHNFRLRNTNTHHLHHLQMHPAFLHSGLKMPSVLLTSRELRKQNPLWIKRDQLDVTCFSISLFNLLKTKRNLLYIRNQSVPRCKHFPTRL